MTQQHTLFGVRTLLFLFLLLCSVLAVNAEDIVATSQFGYHPLSEKRVVLYNLTTYASSGTFTVDGLPDFVGELVVPTDGNGDPTTCQGGLSCLVGNFTNITTPGTYTITTVFGGASLTTAQFTISPDIYADSLPVFFEFFDANRQQDSAYHHDLHVAENPALPTIADGSYILQTDQAALTTVRLASAYRRDPTIFDAAMRARIIDYIDYLLGIRGADAIPGDGLYRFGWEVAPQNAFVPGPTNLSGIDLYTAGGDFLQTVEVTSLCGEDDNTPAWDACIENALNLYQCQVDEPCLNITYVGPHGSIETDQNDHTYPAGWMYDWNCFLDARLETGMFNDAPNPCLMFDEIRGDDMYTLFAFAAFTQAIPTINDQDPAKAVAVYDEARAITDAMGDTFTDTSITALSGVKTMTAEEKYAWAGMGLFLLSDYSGDPSYLTRAHSYRNHVATDFNSASTFGNEYYWEEYIRHEDAIRAAGLEYEIGGNDPRSYLTGKMYFDWNVNNGKAISISGERVYQEMREGFSISRSQLIEGVYAMKTIELAPADAPSFSQEIADSQIAWLTGQNVVQDGETGAAPLRSYSFIFGLGQDTSTQYHSRYLIDTSLYAISGGALLGARGTDIQFMNAGGNLVWMDGRTEILGEAFGALGNDLGQKIDPWLDSRVYANGKTSISGWINGPFDTGDGDVMLNYLDSRDAYLFTETTNEMVAAAVELFAYMDGEYNDRSRHPGVVFNDILPLNATLSFTIDPVNMTAETIIMLNGTSVGTAAESYSLVPGTYEITASAPGYFPNVTTIDLVENEIRNLDLTLASDAPPPVENGTLNVSCTPQANVFLNGSLAGVTPFSGFLSLNLVPGDYEVLFSAPGYTSSAANVTVVSGVVTVMAPIALVADAPPVDETNATLNISSSPAANVSLNGLFVGVAPESGILSLNLLPADYLVEVSAPYFFTNATIMTLSPGESMLHTVTLEPDTAPILLGWNVTNATLGMPGEYVLIETDQIVLDVTFDRNTTITWYVNGNKAYESQGEAGTFAWAPGIFYSDNQQSATILVSGDGVTNKSFVLTVMNVVNPYWQEPDEILHVFTNNDVRNFTNVTVEIEDRLGRRFVELAVGSVDPIQTDWKYLEIWTYGDTFIRKVIVENTTSGTREEYLVDEIRAHFEKWPDGGGGGGGSGGYVPPTNQTSTLGFDTAPPELVYAIFTKDVVAIGERLELNVDVKSDAGIRAAFATITSSTSDNSELSLHRIKGSQEYGTWAVDIDASGPGEHRLIAVRVVDAHGTSVSLPTPSRAYYVTSSDEKNVSSLRLVFAYLDKNIIAADGSVGVKLDAEDLWGITAVNATFKDGERTTTIPLVLTTGDEKYGTWEGQANLAGGDTTFSLWSVTLANEQQAKEVRVYGQRVYLRPQQNALTGAAIASDGLIDSTVASFFDRPRTPIVIGIIGMLLAGGIALVSFVRRRQRMNVG